MTEKDKVDVLISVDGRSSFYANHGLAERGDFLVATTQIEPVKIGKIALYDEYHKVTDGVWALKIIKPSGEELTVKPYLCQRYPTTKW